MNITVNGKPIEADAEGFLKNPDDWNDDVAEVLAKEHEKAGHKPLNETAMGLVGFFVNTTKKNRLIRACMIW